MSYEHFENHEAEAVADRYERAMERLETQYEKQLDKLRDQLDAAWAEGLSASPVACRVADAWVRNQRDVEPQLGSALAAIELATRESPLRKVKS